MNLALIRYAYLPTVTLGWLIAGDLKLATLEEPWIPNPLGPGGTRKSSASRASCVPDGAYVLEPHSGSVQRNVWAMVNPALGVWHWPDDVPSGQAWGRFACLLHVGNTLDDIEGCIALGLRAEPLVPAVRESAAAVTALRGVIGTAERHALTIRPRAGTSETL